MKKVQVATHNGIFHPDEVFALAVLKLVFEKSHKELEIIRTRDLDKIALADMAVDIGGQYDLVKNRFDHHQKGRVGMRQNGIPYATFGLIWKHFGEIVAPDPKVWITIENKLVLPIDSLDNGIVLSTPTMEGVHEYGLGQIFSAIGNLYEDIGNPLAFEKALELALLVLKGELLKAEAKVEGEKFVAEQITKQNIPEILILEKYAKWDDAVDGYKDIKLIIFPDGNSANWCIQAAHDKTATFGVDRISFPMEWRGLTNSELDSATGVKGGVFSHLNGHFTVANSKEVAVELATKTIILAKLPTKSPHNH